MRVEILSNDILKNLHPNCRERSKVAANIAIGAYEYNAVTVIR